MAKQKTQGPIYCDCCGIGIIGYLDSEEEQLCSNCKKQIAYEESVFDSIERSLQ